MIPDAEWEQATSVLAAAQEVAIACHVMPDGDAFGSMLGLASFLRRLDKKVWCSWGADPLIVPAQYAWIKGVDELTHPSEMPESAEVFIAIDCGDIRRLENLRPKFEKAKTRINIDHHVSNDSYGDINLVETTAASSSEIAYQLLRRMGGEPTSDEATCFYTGIVTDTGSFQHSNASVQTLRTAAELREYGVDHQLVAREVYGSTSFEYLHVLGVVLSRARFEEPVVWSWLEQGDLGGLGMEETEDFIDILRQVRGAIVAVMLKEQPSSEWKVSLRSRTDDIDVARIAQAFGGGGHKRAAGFTLAGSKEEVIAAIRARLRA